MAREDLGHPGRAGGDAAATLAHQNPDALAGLPLAELAQDFNGFLRGEISIGVAVDHHHRGQRAAAQTGHLVEGEHAVLGGLAVLNPQLLGNGSADSLRSVDMAGGAVTEHNLIGSHGLEPEIAIKGGNAHDLSRAVARPFCDMVDHFLGQVAIDGLSLLEDHNQTGGIILILAQYAFHQGEVNT